MEEEERGEWEGEVVKMMRLTMPLLPPPQTPECEHEGEI